MIVGVFGGTFDPIHLGHLILAEQCRDSLSLDQVLFVPAGQPPHKLDRDVSDPKSRQEMIELAISGNPAFALSTIELDRTGPSYSVVTLRQLTEQDPNSKLFFLVGGDSLLDMVNWREPKEISTLATVVACTRPGSDLPDLAPLETHLGKSAVATIRQHTIELPMVHISSSAVRERVRNQRSIRYLVPRAVECYIQHHGLYQDQAIE